MNSEGKRQEAKGKNRLPAARRCIADEGTSAVTHPELLPFGL
jgi:hypothetical protein